MIDIIIPAYNSHDTIMRTLFSICYQDISDKFNIYICNDASDINYSKEINFFKDILNIKEITLDKNSGPGVARQVGIDNSTSEYIVFIDSDDVFNSPYSVNILYTTIVNNNLDVVCGAFIEEKEGERVTRLDDNVWLHGKIYRRKFLIEHNIRFNDSYCNEDNGFNQSIMLREPKIAYLDNIVYCWMFNENSITRKNNYKYRYTGLIGYVYNITWALKSAIEDNCNEELISSLALSSITSMYYYYLEFMNEDDSIELLKNTKDLKDIYIKYPVRDLELKQEILDSEYDFFKNEVVNIDNPNITFLEFLDLVSEVEV